ncbi:hypothetical protein N9164_13740 [Draconibacterium sp.]|nr:hypothetical protein [Draconibacterium sp.]
MMLLGKIKRIIRARLRKKHYFTPEAASRFLFFQFNSGNAKWFVDHTDTKPVRIDATPHYRVAKASVTGDAAEVAAAKNNYLSYLKASWPSYGLDTSIEKLEAKYREVLEYIKIIAKDDRSSSPAILTQIPDTVIYSV